MTVQVTGWWADPRATATLEVEPEFSAIVATSYGVHGAAITVTPTFAANLGPVTTFTAAATVTPQFYEIDLARNASAAKTVIPTFAATLQNFKLAAETTVTPQFSAALQNSHLTTGASLHVAVAHSATLSIGMSASLTVTPTFAAGVKFPKVTAAETVTPTFATGLHYTAHASAAHTVTPVFSAALRETDHSALTVTPTFATTFRKVTAGLVAAKTVIPTFSATLKTHAGAALTVTPQFSAGLQSHVTAAKTVTPAFAASLYDTVRASTAKTVTPTFAAAIARGMAAGGGVIPTFATAFKSNISAAQTVTPTFMASSTVTANVLYDATGAGEVEGYGTTCSWTHSAASGAYVLVFVTWYDQSSISVLSMDCGASAMALLGSVTDAYGDGCAVYGLAGVPSGSQTVTVTTSADTTIFGNSISFTNVTSVGSPATATYATTASPLVTCSTGQMIVQSFQDLYGAAAHGTGLTSLSGGTLQSTVDYDSSYVGLSISTATTSTTFDAADTRGGFAGISVVLSA